MWTEDEGTTREVRFRFPIEHSVSRTYHHGAYISTRRGPAFSRFDGNRNSGFRLPRSVYSSIAPVGPLSYRYKTESLCFLASVERKNSAIIAKRANLIAFTGNKVILDMVELESLNTFSLE